MKFIEVKNAAGYRVLINVNSIAYINCVEEISEELKKASKLYSDAEKNCILDINASIVTNDEVVHYVNNTFDDISSQIY